MHKPYGHLKVQERRKLSKNIQPSCRNWLMMLLYAVCCTRMLHGQAVRPSLCMMWEQARCCAGMMLDVQTACVVYCCVCVRGLQHAACSFDHVFLTHIHAYFMINYAHTCCTLLFSKEYFTFFLSIRCKYWYQPYMCMLNIKWQLSLVWFILV